MRSVVTTPLGVGDPVITPPFAQVRKKIGKLQNAMQEFGERFNQEELVRQARTPLTTYCLLLRA